MESGNPKKQPKQRRAGDIKIERRRSRSSVVYFLLNERQGRIKIGFSRVLDRRIRDLSEKHGPLELLATTPGDRMVEAAIHKACSEWRLEGEWFEDCPSLRSAYENFIGQDCGIEDAVKGEWEQAERRAIEETRDVYWRLMQECRARYPNNDEAHRYLEKTYRIPLWTLWSCRGGRHTRSSLPLYRTLNLALVSETKINLQRIAQRIDLPPDLKTGFDAAIARAEAIERRAAA